MLFLRSAAFNLYLYAVTAFMAITCSIGLVLPRQFILSAVNIWSRLIEAGLRILAGTSVEVRGAEFVPTEPVLIAVKHQSMWETLSVFALIKNPAMVLKRELAFIPFFGWCAMRAGMVAVDRDGHAKALRNLVAQAKQRLSEHRSVLIFPEGTRSVPGSQNDYKPGVAALYAQLDVPCVPVALNSGLFWPRRKFLRRPGKIIIEFLPPIEPGLKRRVFARELEARIETASLKLYEEGVSAIRERDASYEPPMTVSPRASE